MKLASILLHGCESYGVISQAGVNMVKSDIRNKYPTLKEFISNQRANQLIDNCDQKEIPFTDFVFLPPITAPEKIICGSSNSQLVDDNTNFVSKNSKNFEYILSSINQHFGKDAFNLIVFSGSKPSSGYKLKLNNIKKNNSIYYLNFININPSEGSASLAVISYPYCILNVENLNKFKIIIN